MRVILMHNPSAGSEDHTARDLMKKIRAAGHEVVADVSRRKDLSAALRKPCDLVAVAGGDGTVGKAADALAGSGIPFTVLPFGTANNTARTLGCIGDEEELIAAWNDGEIKGFDRGSILQGDETTGFIEAFGLGVFPEAIRASKKLEEPEDPDETLDRDLAVFHAVVEKAQPGSYTISADGEDLSGDYLLIEVMNLPYLGPNIPLAPGSVPGDGVFDLVLAREDRRSALLEHVAKIRKGEDSEINLERAKARHIVISCGDRRYHRDGSLSEDTTKGARSLFQLSLEPHALQVLVPPGRWSRA